jgi:hypothetical protein
MSMVPVVMSDFTGVLPIYDILKRAVVAIAVLSSAYLFYEVSVIMCLTFYTRRYSPNLDLLQRFLLPNQAYSWTILLSFQPATS